MRQTLRQRPQIPKRISALLLIGAAGFLLTAALATHGQDVQHLSITVPGGMPGWPVVTGITTVTNGVNVTWDGPSGYYELFATRSLDDPAWVAVGKDTNLIRNATVPASAGNVFFRVLGPSPAYAGSQACLECHSVIVDTEIHTSHAGAFTNASFLADGGQTNISCLACHTVGFGLPTGFSNVTRTPHLEGVQCENCHGPADYHAANPEDPTLVPRVEVASTACGGCHTRRFGEWQTSPHNQVIPNLNEAAEIDSCGRCHSGTARLNLIEGQPLPTGDAEMGIECISCHDPHQTNGYPAQLLYPLASTNDYFMPSNGAFTTYYNTKINVCGQCHNDRGESWTNTAAAPHPSSQYNMLLGTVGELESGPAPYQSGSHALLLTNQCVDCHMQTAPFAGAAMPGDTGHRFTVDRYDVCLQCHPFEPQMLVQLTQTTVSNEIQQVKADLDDWAATKAPSVLWSKYGNLAWEYTVPGPLSSGTIGPDAAEQALISTNIQKARFNVYVVFSEGSLGVHNVFYTEDLLDAAEAWIEREMSQ
jgi:hypothetical protein